MQAILIFIAVLLILLWLAGIVFGLLIHTIGFAIHFAPLIALILVIYVLFLRRQNS